MKSAIDYSKIYTHATEQHPNLILGSLQLLFWLFFRPKAWKNYLKRIDSALDYDSTVKQSLQWHNDKLWKLLLQAYVILPVFTLLIVISQIPQVRS